MSSTLLSTTCYIKTKPYHLRICIDDDLQSTIDTNESTSSAVNSRSSIQLYFESLIDKKKDSYGNNDDTIPEIIILSKLLNIKQTIKLSDESNSSSISQRFGSLSSERSSKSDEMPLSESTQVDLSYVDISESFIWSVKRIQLEMDTTAAAQQLCLISTRYLSKLKHRPRHLLVFINSQCGKGE